MRRALTGLAALAAAAALAVAGCGGDGGSTRAFCDDYREVAADLEGVLQNDADAVEEGFRRLEALDPPDEIKDEFEQIVALARQSAEMAETMDINDPEAVAEAQQRFADRQAELAEASGKVSEFLADKCGIEPPAGAGAADE